jgi:hypothetical protein
LQTRLAISVKQITDNTTRQHDIFHSIQSNATDTGIRWAHGESQVPNVRAIGIESRPLILAISSFCEEDFIITGWVGEFVNTVSNLAYCKLPKQFA